MTLGTGIGGAIVSDGRVLRGAHGLAGEFGHMQVAPDGRACECGQAGCWEQYASGRALVRAAVALDVPRGRADVGARRQRRGRPRGEAWALAAFEEVGTWLGVGLAGLASAFDPELIIVGGGLSETGDLLLAPARPRLRGPAAGRGVPARGRHRPRRRWGPRRVWSGPRTSLGCGSRADPTS